MRGRFYRPRPRVDSQRRRRREGASIAGAAGGPLLLGGDGGRRVSLRLGGAGPGRGGDRGRRARGGGGGGGGPAGTGPRGQGPSLLLHSAPAAEHPPPSPVAASPTRPPGATGAPALPPRCPRPRRSLGAPETSLSPRKSRALTEALSAPPQTSRPSQTSRTPPVTRRSPSAATETDEHPRRIRGPPDAAGPSVWGRPSTPAQGWRAPGFNRLRGHATEGRASSDRTSGVRNGFGGGRSRVSAQTRKCPHQRGAEPRAVGEAED